MADTAPVKLSGLDLVRLTRGFSCVFWALPLAVLFCIQLLISAMAVADPFIRSSLADLYFFLFCAVLAIACIGTYWFSRVEGVGERWRQRARICLACALLTLYFSPFLYWWQAFPEKAFYTLNLFGLILSAIVLLVSLNLLCVELGRFYGDHSLRRESKLFGALNALILGLPTASAFGWAALQSLPENSPDGLGMEFVNLFLIPYYWRMTVFIALFLPVSLTLANLWRVKEMLLDELKKLPGG